MKNTEERKTQKMMSFFDIFKNLMPYVKPHKVLIGITLLLTLFSAGLAQVNGRNAISWEEKFRLDVWYVEHLSFWVDVKPIFLSVKKVFCREGISSVRQPFPDAGNAPATRNTVSRILQPARLSNSVLSLRPSEYTIDYILDILDIYKGKPLYVNILYILDILTVILRDHDGIDT